MKFLLLFISVFFCVNINAQKQVLKFDTSTIKLRSVNVNSYKNKKEFNYTIAKEKKESLWDIFWRWFWETIDAIRKTKSGRTIFDSAVIIIAVSAIVFFIWKITGMKGAGMFGRNESSVAYSIGKDDINTIDFDAAIQTAVDSVNYILAVRLLYLQSLKILSDKSIIDWEINKTNAKYIKEMNNHAQQNNFMQLTNVFDYVWYGNKKLAKEEFYEAYQSFKQFQQAIVSEGI